MSIYTHVNEDGTLFKTNDGKYINYRGCDITSIISRLKKPQKFISLSSQPRFYLITTEWDEVLEQDIVIYICGPYSTKEEAQQREMKNDYILLATDEAITALEVEMGFVAVI